MPHGKVRRPPSFGAVLTSFRQSEAKPMPEVFVVRDGDFVGAAASTERGAQEALDAGKAERKKDPQISKKELFAYLKRNAASKTEDRFRKKKESLEAGRLGWHCR